MNSWQCEHEDDKIQEKKTGNIVQSTDICNRWWLKFDNIQKQQSASNKSWKVSSKIVGKLPAEAWEKLPAEAW